MRARFEKQEYGIKAKHIRGFRGFAPMFHAHMEMIFVRSGEIRMTIDGEAYTVTAGQMGIVFPYTVHSYMDAPEAEVIIMLFSPESAGGFGKQLFSMRPCTPCMAYSPVMWRLAERMLDFKNPTDTLEERTAQMYLGALMGEILMAVGYRSVAGGEWNVMQQILVYCAEQFREDITVRQVARACFASESYVTKIFSGKLQVPFRTYINRLRIAEAEHLLRNTDMKIIDVMLACGFKNQSSFNRVFLAETGETPRKFREKCRL